MNEPLGIMVDITPPTVSIPRDNGVASMITTEFKSSELSPQMIPPYTAAPNATASSGLIPVLGSLPLKKSLTNYLTLGILVLPPTNTISSISGFFNPESFKAS